MSTELLGQNGALVELPAKVLQPDAISSAGGAGHGNPRALPARRRRQRGK